ncbi:MAG TPA: DegV family protein [Firmicutes bacterium]|nr:DegV family protein [Bacillota bacterium]
MIRVVVDTTCSMPLEWYDRHGIVPVPLYVREGAQVQRELFDVSYDEFYQRQRAGAKFSTAQPDPQAFLEVFRPAVEAGDEVICVLLASRISGAVNSANAAKAMLDTDRVSIVDSRQSGFGQAMLALQAKELADAGVDRPEILRALDDQIGRSRTFFVVESLRYLYEGGRLSGAQALIGSLIQIKPIIWFAADGTLEAKEKIRTLKAAKARLLELVKQRVGLGVGRIGLHYGDNLEEATAFARELEAIAGAPVPLVKLSPVIASHTGPDILGPTVITLA